MAKKNKTVGQHSYELLQKTPDSTDPIEIQREMQKGYIKELVECAERHKKKFPGDFYITVITKKEPLMQNVLRNYFSARSSCPTPQYDEAVYFYDSAADNIEYLWVVPDKETCEMYIENQDIVDPEEYGILKCVLNFYSGKLLKFAQKRNNEDILDPNVVLKKNKEIA